MLAWPALRFHLVVEQADNLFEQIHVLGAENGLHLLEQFAPALKARNKALNTESRQRTVAALKSEQLVKFLRGELAGAVRVALDPGTQFGLGGLGEEAPEPVFIRP